MQFIPEWAPNIHPLIIHFPIALLVVAVFLDVVSVWLKKDWLRNSTLMMYFFGTLGAITAYFTGRIAANSVNPSFQAELTMSKHSDWALYTVIFFSIYTILRIVFKNKLNPENRIIHLAVLAVTVFGLFLLVSTADLGGKLVFKYGVGQFNHGLENSLNLK